MTNFGRDVKTYAEPEMIFNSMVTPLIYALMKVGFHAPITYVDIQHNHVILNTWYLEIF